MVISIHLNLLHTAIAFSSAAIFFGLICAVRKFLSRYAAVLTSRFERNKRKHAKIVLRYASDLNTYVFSLWPDERTLADAIKSLEEARMFWDAKLYRRCIKASNEATRVFLETIERLEISHCAGCK